MKCFWMKILVPLEENKSCAVIDKNFSKRDFDVINNLWSCPPMLQP